LKICRSIRHFIFSNKTGKANQQVMKISAIFPNFHTGQEGRTPSVVKRAKVEAKLHLLDSLKNTNYYFPPNKTLPDMHKSS
jgi:hypothetical protein